MSTVAVAHHFQDAQCFPPDSKPPLRRRVLHSGQHRSRYFPHRHQFLRRRLLSFGQVVANCATRLPPRLWRADVHPSHAENQYRQQMVKWMKSPCSVLRTWLGCNSFAQFLKHTTANCRLGTDGQRINTVLLELKHHSVAFRGAAIKTTDT